MILIDAAHLEETRVAFVVDSRLDEYVSESAERKILKGNIYLGRITRIEPSLQAAFIDYGGGRHGFISFHDIHPDYFRIPVSDREDESDEASGNSEDFDDDDSVSDFPADSPEASPSPSEVGGDDYQGSASRQRQKKRQDPHRQYKIQEVLSNEKPLLVQVVKEERGTKGAALTTYLSLAGRCCVLMPNSTRSGGISRRIEDVGERKRLRDIVSSLDVPLTMSVILRTAIRGRTKLEIKRDYEHLLSLWESIRQLTLQSTAPVLVHEEGDLVSRTLRDMYTNDVDEVIVSGKDALDSARVAMGRVASSHLRRIKQHKPGGKSLFQEYGVEEKIAEIYRPRVLLRSGGYIVMQQTEALVSIDVNSGKSTRERHIDVTALRTNLEAAEEICRQLRLRDLAGLIVIDFIDMDGHRYKVDVENRMRELLLDDRARIQMGRISYFSLLELSRQRLHPTVYERASLPCEACSGTGYVPARSVVLLSFLRSLEEMASKTNNNEGLELRAVPELGLAFLNEKRQSLISIEERYGVSIDVTFDSNLQFGESKILRVSARAPRYSSDESPLSPPQERRSSGKARRGSYSDSSRASSSRRRSSAPKVSDMEVDMDRDDDRDGVSSSQAMAASTAVEDRFASSGAPDGSMVASAVGSEGFPASASSRRRAPRGGDDRVGVRARRGGGRSTGRGSTPSSASEPGGSATRAGHGGKGGESRGSLQPDDSDPRDFLGTDKTL